MTAEPCGATPPGGPCPAFVSWIGSGVVPREIPATTWTRFTLQLFRVAGRIPTRQPGIPTEPVSYRGGAWRLFSKQAITLDAVGMASDTFLQLVCVNCFTHA
jgi:hypothetical protein